MLDSLRENQFRGVSLLIIRAVDVLDGYIIKDDGL